jgi:hypothetical protein
MSYEALPRTLPEIEHHWQGDQLSRAKLGLDVERYILARSTRPLAGEKGLTIAIDGDYGAGKIVLSATSKASTE